MGFDCRVTASGIESLLSSARALIPSLVHARFREAWAGLRPGSPDGLPAIGPVLGVSGLAVAAGHFRHGVLLSPVTGQLIAAWALGKALPQRARAFEPGRWR